MQDGQKDTLYIIDTHAEIFRAYHAIRGGLTSSVTGEPTHAVFGFAGTLIRNFVGTSGEICRRRH